MLILSVVAETVRPIDRFVLNGVPPSLATRTLPLTSVAERRDRRVLATFGSGGWAEYEAGVLSSKMRRELRRQMKRLRALGPVTVRREQRDYHGVMRTLGRLHIERCATRTIRSPFGHDSLRLLYAQARTAACTGSLAAYALAVGDEPVAAVLSFELRQRSWITHLAFDPSFSSYGPGILLLREMLEDLAARGIRIVDFGMGDLPHKQRLGSATEPWYACSGRTAGVSSVARSGLAELGERVRFVARDLPSARWVRFRVAGGLARQLHFLDSELSGPRDVEDLVLEREEGR
jgi:CelD/BcsL family acetyltransferase involved in cellulose biosynthesis